MTQHPEKELTDGDIPTRTTDKHKQFSVAPTRNVYGFFMVYFTVTGQRIPATKSRSRQHALRLALREQKRENVRKIADV